MTNIFLRKHAPPLVMQFACPTMTAHGMAHYQPVIFVMITVAVIQKIACGKNQDVIVQGASGIPLLSYVCTLEVGHHAVLQMLALTAFHPLIVLLLVVHGIQTAIPVILLTTQLTLMLKD